MGLYSWLMAQSYDLAMGKTEALCLGNWRNELLNQASGELLEIGAGTGVNLPYYPAGLTQLILSEPVAPMRAQLQTKLATNTHQQVRVVDWVAERIDLPDQSIDTVVSTLVLCSVKNLQMSLLEVYRVLRPGGQLLFLEHVLANDARTLRWQNFWHPFWRCCCGNCHLTRDTVRDIEAAGMIIEQLQEAEMLGAPAIVRRTMRGIARKPATEPEIFVQIQEFDLGNVPPCPHCGSNDVAKMLYGKPALTRQILEGLESGKIISGGCMIHGGAPGWHCNHCHQDFGHLQFDSGISREHQ
jgi:2-polyprenyl-3-methyl-5-hydroxy-6-metoxy-1,4-benzoquinol methylase